MNDNIFLKKQQNTQIKWKQAPISEGTLWGVQNRTNQIFDTLNHGQKFKDKFIFD